jgi:ribosomal protein S18 acetylase RimI-like enzyme
VKELLNNPVFNALSSGDKHLGFGTEKARAFDQEVSPFAGFEENYAGGFEELHDILPEGRYILYACPSHISTPAKWKLIVKVEGIQMIHKNLQPARPFNFELVPLTRQHVTEMVELAELTKPGPFGNRTIEFGHYFGVFENGKLVAMAGQRMHFGNYSEISAVCTHPDALGKGYGHALVQHQLQLIYEQNRQPILHVKADNDRAIQLYERLGFELRGPMNFYFLRREK